MIITNKRKAIKDSYSQEFKKRLLNVQNPYGDGGAAKRIVETISNVDLSSLIHKEFYDLKPSYTASKIKTPVIVDTKRIFDMDDAKKSNLIDKIIVSTDDEKIIKISMNRSKLPVKEPRTR